MSDFNANLALTQIENFGRIKDPSVADTNNVISLIDDCIKEDVEEELLLQAVTRMSLRKRGLDGGGFPAHLRHKFSEHLGSEDNDNKLHSKILQKMEQSNNFPHDDSYLGTAHILEQYMDANPAAYEDATSPKTKMAGTLILGLAAIFSSNSKKEADKLVSELNI